MVVSPELLFLAKSVDRPVYCLSRRGKAEILDKNTSETGVWVRECSCGVCSGGGRLQLSQKAKPAASNNDILRDVML